MHDDDLTRKEQKHHKKQISKSSKFKKSDRSHWELKRKNKQEILLSKKENLLQGRVLSIAPQAISVDVSGQTYTCTLGGRFKQEKRQQKTLLTIGDFVLFDPTTGQIAAILERVSILSRCDHLRQRKEQILAANVDQVLITVSAQSPPLKPTLIDRYLIAALKGNLHPIILINKIDLLKPNSPEEILFHQVMALYQHLNIPILAISATSHTGLDTLKALMTDKTSVFSGQSGVGKSSLINQLTGLSLLTQKIRRQDKGMHTTTRTQLLPLPFGGWCVDTPGIRSFGVWDLTLADLESYFPEIVELGKHCHFPNCSHTHEPHCHVQEALQANTLSPIRYDSYLKLRLQLSTPHLSR